MRGQVAAAVRGPAPDEPDTGAAAGRGRGVADHAADSDEEARRVRLHRRLLRRRRRGAEPLASPTPLHPHRRSNRPLRKAKYPCRTRRPSFIGLAKPTGSIPPQGRALKLLPLLRTVEGPALVPSALDVVQHLLQPVVHYLLLSDCPLEHLRILLILTTHPAPVTFLPRRVRGKRGSGRLAQLNQERRSRS